MYCLERNGVFGNSGSYGLFASNLPMLHTCAVRFLLFHSFGKDRQTGGGKANGTIKALSEFHFLKRSLNGIVMRVKLTKLAFLVTVEKRAA